MLFENVTLSNRCYFWSPSNFILVKKALAEVKRLLAGRSGWYMGSRSRLLSCAVSLQAGAEACNLQPWSGCRPALTNAASTQQQAGEQEKAERLTVASESTWVLVHFMPTLPWAWSLLWRSTLRAWRESTVLRVKRIMYNLLPHWNFQGGVLARGDHLTGKLQ